MKKHSFIRLAAQVLFVGLLCFSTIPGFGQEKAADSGDEPATFISGGAEVDVNSQYLWRGIVFEDHAVIQPTVWVTAHDLTLSVWNNRAARDNDFVSGNEVDFAAAYARSIASAEIELSYSYYTYPHQVDSPPTGEAAISAALPIIAGLGINTTQTLDVNEYPGAYFGEFGVGFERELPLHLTLETGAALGWGSAEFNETYAGVRQSAWNGISARAGVTYEWNDYLYVKPHAELFHTLDRGIANVTQRDVVNIGATLGLSL